MTPHLILTVDYELFGNGSGNLEDCVVRPADRLLGVAEEHGAPVTFFVEALEFYRMHQAVDKGASDLRPALRQVHEQLRDAVARGHDVQLHLHPQWMSATRTDGGVWAVDTSRWRLGDQDAEVVRAMVRRGVRFLEKLLRPVSPEYSPDVFRAGAWCIQPSRSVLEALSAEGVKLDSSVAPGLRNPSPGNWFDFRDAPPDRSFWRVGEDICRPHPTGPVLEVPIATGHIPPLDHILDTLRSRWIEGGNSPTGCRGSFATPNSRPGRLLGRIARLLNADMSMLDYCRLPAALLEAVTAAWLADRPAIAETAVPVVAIGHTKTFGQRAEDALSEFLRELALRGDVEFGTYGSWIGTLEGPEYQAVRVR